MTSITSNSTVAEIMERSSVMADILEQLGINAKDSPDVTLHDACLDQDLYAPTVIDLLLRADAPETTKEPDHDLQATLTELTDRIAAKYHRHLQRDLPRLQMLLDHAVLQASDHSLEQIRITFLGLRAELEEHLLMQKQVLFPLIEEIEWAKCFPGRYGGVIDRSIAQATHDHNGVGRTMSVLRRQTSSFTPPATARVLYRSFLKGLTQLEEEMHQNTHLEVNILLPRAIADEAKLRRRQFSNSNEVVFGEMCD